MIADSLMILFISLCTALLSEGLSYVLLYRTEGYKRLKDVVEKQSRKLERKKETVGEGSVSGTQKRKKLEKQEEQLKNYNKDLSMVKMKSMVLIGLTFTALLGMFNTIFDGRVVAKLPFTPFGILQGISHRNLMGTDMTDCSFIFLYILCTMSIRENLQKLMGVGVSRSVSKLGNSLVGPSK
ncbi:PREDICTED: calcium load-activated calcium channel-like [Amphimedon queenslandica]|uniref:Calcium load-activated calcium channel n=1 Tax=Amphimedon queenslandica TaxID=400682 RepID=A0A1X7UN15_AMPQE|nr:PREDICTED: calcium load-activated calcium channel-like [Amphimedon queenslandica]|eukprot:XP_003387319.1 PREDICTED: calcium load-activated calcium channel-like [Amphimedon queenslandica]